jgi:integrase
MPLKVDRRKDTGALTITGTVAGERIRTRAQSDVLGLAREEAAALEARLLREAWHGQRRGVSKFAEAAEGWLTDAPRAAGDKARLHRILRALGNVTLAEVDQAAVDRVRRSILKPDASPATVRRSVVAPIRLVIMRAHRRGQCDRPVFEIPRESQGRTNFLLPGAAEGLVAAAAPHLKPLFITAIGTGARLSELLELDWRDTDLAGGRIIFWKTKSGRRRIASLPPRVVAALAGLSHRDGPVFRWETKPRHDGTAKRVSGYADRGRQGGGQIKKGWAGALRRAGLDPALTPHDLRHTWASWHYALHRDLLALKVEGGWSSVALVERYAHLMPAGHEAAIRAFLGHGADTAAQPDLVTA